MKTNITDTHHNWLTSKTKNRNWQRRQQKSVEVSKFYVAYDVTKKNVFVVDSTWIPFILYTFSIKWKSVI